MRRLVRLGFLLVVLIGVLFLFGFPARTYLDQQRALVSAEDRVQVLEKGTKVLDDRVKALQDDAAVERLAREQYNLVRPGEEAYAILPGPAAAEPAPIPRLEAKQDAPGFWSRLWDRATFWS